MFAIFKARKIDRLEPMCVILAAALLGMGAFYWSLFLAKHLPEYIPGNLLKNLVLQMDVQRVVRTVTEHWNGEGSRTTVHPLMPLLFQPVAHTVSHLVPSNSDLRIAQLTTGMFMALSASLLFIAAYYYSRRYAWAAIVVFGYALSFGYIILSTFPESSGLATYSVILPYTIYALHREKPIGRIERVLYLLAGLLSIGVTTSNFFHALMVYAIRLWYSMRQKLLILFHLTFYAVSVTFIAAVLSVLQRKVFYLGSEYWFLPSSVSAETRWLALWWDGMFHPLRVLIQLLVYSVVGIRLSFTDLGCQIEGIPILQLSAETVKLSDISVWRIGIMALFLTMVIFFSRSKPFSPDRVPLFWGLGYSILLHIVYGNELLLYSGHWLPVLWLIFATADYSRLRILALSCMIFLIAYNNRTAFKEMYQQMNVASAYASLQIPVGLPLQHEFQRAYVDWAGNFSPGIGSNGVLLSVFDVDAQSSNLSSLVEHRATHTLLRELPIPIIRSEAGSVLVEQSWYPLSDGVLVRVRLGRGDASKERKKIRVYLLVGNRGPTSSAYRRRYQWDAVRQWVMSDSHIAIRCSVSPDFVLYHPDYRILFNIMLEGKGNLERQARDTKTPFRSIPNNATNLLLGWELIIAVGEEKILWLHCPYSLPALSSEGVPLYQIVNLSPPADTHPPKSRLTESEAISLAQKSVQTLTEINKAISITVPSREWREGLHGAIAHLAQSVQHDGRIPVTPINYGVFIRDAAYMVYALLIAGQYEYAKLAIDYMLRHPWEGRRYPEGDAAGHLLWVMHKYWLFTRDETWLKQKLPAIRNLARCIMDMRSDGMHPAEVNLLGQKRTIPASPRLAQQLQKKAGRIFPFYLNYGTMDQGGLLYVNLVSLTGLRGAVDMLNEFSSEEASNLRHILQDYLQEFTNLLETIDYDLSYDKRGYCFATWPAQIHSVIPKAREYFVKTGFDSQVPISSWKYLDMDYAHNFLIAGHRSAGYRVVQRYLNLYTFKMWKLLDEGGPSSQGYWKLLSNPMWNPEVAIPHGWSIASLVLLMRDALVYEDDGSLVLLSGIPPAWFGAGKKLSYSLPTEYGLLRVYMECKEQNIILDVEIAGSPPKGISAVLPETPGERRVRITPGRNVILRMR